MEQTLKNERRERTIEMNGLMNAYVEKEKQTRVFETSVIKRTEGMVVAKNEIASMKSSWVKSVAFYKEGIKTNNDRLQTLKESISPPTDEIERCESSLVKLELLEALEEKNWMNLWSSACADVEDRERCVLMLKCESLLTDLEATQFRQLKDHVGNITACEDSFSVHDRTSGFATNSLQKLREDLSLKGNRLRTDHEEQTRKVRATNIDVHESYEASRLELEKKRELMLNDLIADISTLQAQHLKIFGITL